MIRCATHADVPAIRDCAQDAYEHYVEAIGKKPAPMIADFELQVARGWVHVVCPSKRVEGFIVFYRRGERMFLENVAVSRSAQGKGLGKRLIGFCETEARKDGLASIELYTNEKMTSNLSLYPHLGYREFDRRQEDGFNRIYFRKTLS